jgi:FMN phosphatase YigB (HAD superfamily)
VIGTGWIGFDLDGTLASQKRWSAEEIGEPVAAMVELVKAYLRKGYEVRILTARVSLSTSRDGEVAYQRHIIQKWCEKHIGEKLEVVASKDYHMLVLYDDRCVQVVPNTGEVIGRPWFEQ